MMIRSSRSCDRTASKTSQIAESFIDLRDNPGGLIWAAERMLQLFTPNPITPTKFGLRATPLTNAMASARFNQGELGPWADSIASAPASGEPYSTHLPITSS